ncbi:MAG: c-type cytochrome [Acidobacteriota bacterium]
MVLLCWGLLFFSGCMRGCTSSRPPIDMVPNMDNQPKYRAQAASRFFYNGAAMRTPVDGTVARGDLRANEALYSGKDAAGAFVQNPLQVDEDLISRGEERFQIHCSPCHGIRADGQSVLLARSGLQSTNLLESRIREMPDGQIFDVIANGLGLMPSYRHPVQPADRWAIVAYIRRLQAAQSEGVRE